MMRVNKEGEKSAVGDLQIDGTMIGSKHPPYVICELSGNHNGDFNKAVSLIEAAATTGASAIKLQTYKPETMTIRHDGAGFSINGGLWKGRSLYDLYEEAHTPYEWHKDLFARAKELGVTLISTPFDESAVDLLEKLNCPAYKIASFEATDLPLVRFVAQTGKPLIISTGMCEYREIQETVETARSSGCRDLVLLHCISEYPAPIENCNIRTVPFLANSFSCVAGLSDHTLGVGAATAAVALGGAVIEKHMTLRRADGGPDASFSLEPAEFTDLVRSCRETWCALGEVKLRGDSCEPSSLQFRRSLYIVAPIEAGGQITKDNMRAIRPGYGLPPKYYDQILGRRVTRAVHRGEALSWDMVQL